LGDHVGCWNAGAIAWAVRARHGALKWAILRAVLDLHVEPPDFYPTGRTLTVGLNHLLKGACLGAGAMYFLDPDRGRRRRALLRDQAVGASHYLARQWDATIRDFNNRLSGFIAEIERFGRSEPVSDNQLAGRVRSKLGRFVSDPRAIDVDVHDGHVTLRGPVLASEAQSAFDAIRAVRGVTHVANEMETRSEPVSSSLRGDERRWGETPVGGPTTWPPSARLGAAAGGLLLMLFGLPRLTSLTGLATGLGLAMGLASESSGHRRHSRWQRRGDEPIRGSHEPTGHAARSRGPSAPPHEDLRGDVVPAPETSHQSMFMSPPQPARFPPPIQRGVDS
jgi:hypothetical protein